MTPTSTPRYWMRRLIKEIEEFHEEEPFEPYLQPPTSFSIHYFKSAIGIFYRSWGEKCESIYQKDSRVVNSVLSAFAVDVETVVGKALVTSFF